MVFFAMVVFPARVMGQVIQVYKDGEHTVRVWNLGYDGFISPMFIQMHPMV